MSITRTLQYSALLSVFFVPLWVHAATLSVVPSSANLTSGATFTVSVLVDSGGTAINNAEGVLSFPQNLFDVVSINKDASLFSLWIQAPTFDGNNTISFNGGLPSPGYQGSGGRLFTVTLHARTAGSGVLTLDNGAVRANDGFGTDVLQGVHNATITVLQPAAPEPTPATPVTTSPVPNGTIAISSPTNPSQDGWYSNTQATLAWNLPAGVDAVETLVSKTEGATPTVTYRPAITQKIVDNLDEGIWYFNLRAHTVDGWGPVSSYRLQIDTTPPHVSSATIAYDAGAGTVIVNGIASIADSLSGISSIAVLVDGSAAASIPADTSAKDTYTLPVTVQAGQHTIMLKVTDKAGNSAESNPLSVTITRTPTWEETLLSDVLSAGLNVWILMVALALSGLSLLMNMVLWRKLRWYEQNSTKAAPVSKVQRIARQKLVMLRRDLQKQVRELERAGGRGDMTPNDAAYLKKIREHLTETNAFLGQKIKDVERK